MALFVDLDARLAQGADLIDWLVLIQDPAGRYEGLLDALDGAPA